MGKLRAFVSSVQKELENERIAVSELVADDLFLDREVDMILFENLPASSTPAQSAYLDTLNTCDIYVGIIGFEYGQEGTDGMSATHREYKAAINKGLPTYFFIKGDSTQDGRRDNKLTNFFTHIRDEQSGHVYKRFPHYRALKDEVRSILLNELEKRGIHPTAKENEIAEQTIAQASDFDSRLSYNTELIDLDMDLCLTYTNAVLGDGETETDKQVVIKTLTNRGMLWYEENSQAMRPTNAGILLFGKEPGAQFPQVRIAANAYSGMSRSDPIDREDIRAALPKAVEISFRFLKRNMRHTVRIEGFSKVEVDEYCYPALREAVVNAVAHRDYDHQGSSIRIEKYKDRIEIISPGLPPDPITLDKIENLDYIACSRNPNLARGLSYFERIEEQGDGLRRIVHETVRLGLPKPFFQFKSGHFVVVFPAPEDILAIKGQYKRPIFRIDEADQNRLSETQKSILKILLEENVIYVSDLSERLGKSQQAIRKALKTLRKRNWIIQEGKARETYYRLNEEGRAD